MGMFVDIPLLINMPEQAVFGFFNDEDKIAYIGYSKNSLLALSRILNNLKYSNNLMAKHYSKLKFAVIENCRDSNRLKVRRDFWMEQWRQMGYRFYNDRKSISYKLRIEAIPALDKGPGSDLLAYVKLVSRGRREVIVGVFDNMADAEAFANEKYPRIDDIIYANNNLTLEYLSKL